MEDAELARRAAEGDQGAWASIYDRYADRLHDYCHSILCDRYQAGDALHDAFVTAATKIGQLRDPERLRPWLYAICRTQALAAIRRRNRELPDEDVAEMSPPTFDRADYLDAELRQLVVDAAGGLEAKDRAVLDLHLRHGLEGKELGEALGVSAHNATVQLGRVRGHVERSLSALLVGRTGRRDCAELDAVLAGWDGSLSPLIRKRVARHIDGCDVCGERRKRMVSPLTLLGSVPFIPAPPELRTEILGDIELVSATRPRAVHGAGAARAWKVAAGFVGLLLIGGVLFGTQRPWLTPGNPVGIASGPTELAGPPTEIVASSITTTIPRPAVVTPPPVPTRAVTTTTTVLPTTTTTTTPADVAPPVLAEPLTDRTWIAPAGQGCDTTVASVGVADDSPVKVALHWRQGKDGGIREIPMTDQGEGAFTGTIGPVKTAEAEILWWVSAVDSAGNLARSDERTLPVRTFCDSSIG